MNDDAANNSSWPLSDSRSSSFMEITQPQYLEVASAVRIDLKTMKVTFLNGTTPDEAAQKFWDAVERMGAKRICQEPKR